MRGVSKLLLALALVALSASAFAACGGEETDGSTVDLGAAARESTATTAEDSGERSGSAGFRTPGGDNSIQNFGEEADAAEVAAATTALAGYMAARAQVDWERQCAFLAEAVLVPFEELAADSPQVKGKGCAAVLAALSGDAPRSTRVNTMTGPIAALRFEGSRGFALYHGPQGVDYFVPMVKEDGEWKVGALAPTEFP